MKKLYFFIGILFLLNISGCKEESIQIVNNDSHLREMQQTADFAQRFNDSMINCLSGQTAESIRARKMDRNFHGCDSSFRIHKRHFIENHKIPNSCDPQYRQSRRGGGKMGGKNINKSRGGDFDRFYHCRDRMDSIRRVHSNYHQFF